MITEIAKVLGYGDSIAHLDVDRIYYPIALEAQSMKSEAIANELLRLLKAGQGLQFVPRAISDIEVVNPVQGSPDGTR